MEKKQKTPKGAEIPIPKCSDFFKNLTFALVQPTVTGNPPTDFEVRVFHSQAYNLKGFMFVTA